MDLIGVLYLLSFFMTLRLIGFRFFRPTVCPRCQRDETTARRELWRILNSVSGVGLKQCTEELQQQGVDEEIDEVNDDDNEEIDEVNDDDNEEIDEVNDYDNEEIDEVNDDDNEEIDEVNDDDNEEIDEVNDDDNEEIDEVNDNEEIDNLQPEQKSTRDQSAIIGQMLNALKKNTDGLGNFNHQSL
jgi:hypothetical protein